MIPAKGRAVMRLPEATMRGGRQAALGAALLKSLDDCEVKEKIAAEGAYPAGGTPGEFAAFMRSELQKYGRLAVQAGLKR